MHKLLSSWGLSQLNKVSTTHVSATKEYSDNKGRRYQKRPNFANGTTGVYAVQAIKLGQFQ